MRLITEIHIFNYRESVKWAQRSMNVGLMVSALVFLTIDVNSPEDLPAVPILGIHVSSTVDYHLFLLALFFGSGLFSLFYVLKASDILLLSISDTDVARAVGDLPTIIVSNTFCRTLLSGVLICSGAVLFFHLFDWLPWYLRFPMIGLVITPHYVSLSVGKEIYQKIYGIS